MIERSTHRRSLIALAVQPSTAAMIPANPFAPGTGGHAASDQPRRDHWHQALGRPGRLTRLSEYPAAGWLRFRSIVCCRRRVDWPEFALQLEYTRRWRPATGCAPSVGRDDEPPWPIYRFRLASDMRHPFQPTFGRRQPFAHRPRQELRRRPPAPLPGATRETESTGSGRNRRNRPHAVCYSVQNATLGGFPPC